MTKHMAVEWGEKGIRVNGIAPGPIGGTVGMEKLGKTNSLRITKLYYRSSRTRFNYNFIIKTMTIGGKSELAEKMKKIIPLQRWGLKTEIADSCLYLASEVSSFTTGHVMVVDGGEWLVTPNFIPKM